MRIIFLGTPDFAAYSLQVLHEAGKEIVAVITAPDKKAGRGQQARQSAVKKYALEHQILCLQPTNLKNESFLKELKELRADIQIVVAFRMLPEVVWNMPPKGTMNLHASLLPYYRGAAPINWSIINGEKYSGVSTFFLKHEIDTGEILNRTKVEIDCRETAGSLHDKLMHEGANLLLKSINQVESGDYNSQKQESLIGENETIDTLPIAPKLFREDCQINWEMPTTKIDCLIRGLSPYPAAWTTIKRKGQEKGLNLKIYLAVPTDQNASKSPGTVEVIEGKLMVHTSDKVLEVLELQLEGKKRMNASSFLNGIKINDYEDYLY